MGKEISQELIGLIKLISFFKQLRHKQDLDQTGFYFVNDLYNIIEYRQCVLWSYANKNIKLLSASGQVDVQNNTPLAQFLKKILKKKINDGNLAKRELSERGDAEEKDDDDYVVVQTSDFRDYQDLPQADIKNFIAPHVVNLFLYDQEKLIGGVWIDRNNPLGQMEKAVLEDLGDALASRLQFFFKARKLPGQSIFKTGKFKALVVLALLIFLLWPVRYSVTASAEVIAEDMEVVTIPFNSRIEEVYVSPNEDVVMDQPLFALDKTRLQNEYNLALQELFTARQKLSKTERETFSDPSKRPEVNILQEEVKLKQVAANFAREKLEQVEVRARKSGIVLFSDKNDLMGRPVQTGDQVMILADPAKMQLLVKIPADGIIDLDQSIPAKFFLNVEPLKSHEAILDNVSYQPTKDAGGLLTYKARAEITDKEAIERVGLTGTAKLYGDRTVMILNLLRRPYIALRNLLNF